jgi:hypothetical protein
VQRQLLGLGTSFGSILRIEKGGDVEKGEWEASENLT